MPCHRAAFPAAILMAALHLGAAAGHAAPTTDSAARPAIAARDLAEKIVAAMACRVPFAASTGV